MLKILLLIVAAKALAACYAALRAVPELEAPKIFLPKP